MNRQAAASHFIVCGRSTDVLRALPDQTFDAIITDPPYGTAHKNDVDLKGRKPISMDFGHWDYFKDDAFSRFTAEWMAEAVRVLKPMGNLVIFTKLERLETVRRIYEHNGVHHHGTLIWHKTNPPPKIRKNGFLSACEGILWGTLGFDRKRVSYTFNFLSQKQMHNFIETPICMGRERLKHPTQKPLKIFRWLLSIFTNEHDFVLDCFAGSGTLADAAARTSRSSLSIECSESYCRMAEQRLSGNGTGQQAVYLPPEDLPELAARLQQHFNSPD